LALITTFCTLLSKLVVFYHFHGIVWCPSYFYQVSTMHVLIGARRADVHWSVYI